jgi:hypothetical protein
MTDPDFRLPTSENLGYNPRMNWHRLDRDKTITMINSVKTAAEALLFSPVTSEAKCARLPFSESFLLYRLTNYASLPTFSMDFLSNGEQFFYLDGSDHALREITQIAGLNLTAESVIPYLNFYFLNVRLPEGEIVILKDPGEAHTLDLYDDERRENIFLVPEAAKIEEVPETGAFKVTAPVYYDGTYMEAIITVSKDGIVHTAPQRMLTSVQ